LKNVSSRCGGGEVKHVLKVTYQRIQHMAYQSHNKFVVVLEMRPKVRKQDQVMVDRAHYRPEKWAKIHSVKI